jgi:DNA-binding MarR family transcriptional regulator
MPSAPSRKTRRGSSNKKIRVTDGKKRPPISRTRRVVPSVSSPALLDPQGKTDHRFRQFLYDFSTLGVSLEIVRSHLASLLGLTSPQYNIIMVLANGGGTGISVSEVARRLHVSTAFIAAEGINLESTGLIEKHRNPNDGRGVLLHLTPLGWERVAHIGPERQKINDHLFGGLSAQGFRSLAETLASLLDDFNYTVRLIKNAPSARDQSDYFPVQNFKALKGTR